MSTVPFISSPTVDRDPSLPRVVGADQPVPLVTGEHVPQCNLDLAASAPALVEVAEHVAELLPYYASVHRGAGYASRVCTAVLEHARETVARFVGARPGEDVVVFTRNTTDALNLLARAVPGPVLYLDIEHHANLLAWHGTPHRVVRAADTLDRTLSELRAALDTAPVALLAITGASNVTGEIVPLDTITELAHQAGARVAVDAAQLAPHRTIDLAASGVDYLALSGHKLYAPYGAGALIGRRDWLDRSPAHLAGGGAVRSVAVRTAEPVSHVAGTTDVTWLPAPHRHEGGTPNLIGAAALAQACRVLERIRDATEAHERALLNQLTRGLSALPGVQALTIWPDSTERVAVSSFVVDGYDPGLVAAYLSAEHGIAVRDGRFCAHPLVDRLVGNRPGAVRASLGLSTRACDINRLLTALRALLEHGPRWKYTQVDGRWVPVPDPRDLDPLRLGVAPISPPGCGDRPRPAAVW